VIIPGIDETPARPAFLDRPFRQRAQPTLAIWGALVSDLTLVKVEGGHFVPWENPDAVVRAIRGWR
jgi:pimeloyl-ACP methyl ester carboxylesterase